MVGLRLPAGLVKTAVMDVTVAPVSVADGGDFVAAIVASRRPTIRGSTRPTPPSVSRPDNVASLAVVKRLGEWGEVTR